MATSDRDHDQRPRDGRGRFIRGDDTAHRDAEACRLRTLGATYQQIADQLRYSDRSEARHAVQRGLRAVVAEPAAELRTLELARLDELWMRAWAVLQRRHVTVSAGRLIRGTDGMPVVDDSPVLAAIDRLLKIQERRARLLGLDAPTRVQTITVDAIEAEIERLAGQLGTVAEGRQ